MVIDKKDRKFYICPIAIYKEDGKNRCHGHDCMAWVWEKVPSKEDKKILIDSTNLGHCGLFRG